MACLTSVICTRCDSPDIRKSGFNRHGEQRYLCLNAGCVTKSLMLKYRYKACEHGVQKQVVNMAINGSGTQDTSRVLHISKTTTIDIIKRKANNLVQVNPDIKSLGLGVDNKIRLEPVCDAAELDEKWSFVGRKSNQRWLWHAVDHASNTVLAYVSDKRKDKVFPQLKGLSRAVRHPTFLYRRLGCLREESGSKQTRSW